MTIGIDASRYELENATGVEWYSFHIINALLVDLKEHDLRLYVREKKNLKNSKLVSGKRLWTLFWLSLELFRNPVDILFVPSHTFPLVTGKKNVITIHDVAFMKFKDSYKWLQRMYLLWSTRRAVKIADKIIVPSQATKDDLLRYFKCNKDKIEVVFHGSEQATVAKKKEKWILFVGRVEKKKNVKALVEGFKIFSKRHLNWELKIAGSAGFGSEEIFAAAQGKKNIEFLGYISESQKKELYAKSKIFAFPSLYEGFGLPVLEALANSCIVACSNSGSLPEVGGDAVEYFESFTAGDIANGLENALKNEAQLLENSKKQLENFSWEKAGKQTADILTKLYE